ncbi:phenoloxidase-activating factor 2-like [Aphomia sociella]
MYKILMLFALLSAAYGAERFLTNAEIDALITDVFKDSSSSPASNPRPTSNASPTSNPSPSSNSSSALSSDAPSTAATPSPQSKPSGDATCVNLQNEVGKCVPYYKCREKEITTTTDYGVIDLHFDENVCKWYLDVCCSLNNILTAIPTEEPAKKKGCGYRNENGVGFLLLRNNASEETSFGEFPWVVAILKLEPVDQKDPEGPTKEVYAGSGSLIHPQVVLTAAHVAQARNSPVGKLRVRAGEWDTQNTKEIYPHQDRDVETVEIHKDYSQGTLYYDIAVLFLSTPLELTPNIGVACLPPAKEHAEAGTRCIATGWGKDKFGKEGSYQTILKKVEVPVVEHRSCLKLLQNTRLGTRFTLHSSFMCAGGERDRDTCLTDGGAPLVCPIQYETGRYMQSGIVAWGVGCGKDSPPSVYVDVGNLRDWIDDKVAGRGFDPATYTY